MVLIVNILYSYYRTYIQLYKTVIMGIGHDCGGAKYDYNIYMIDVLALAVVLLRNDVA